MSPVLNGTWWYQWGTNGTDPDVTPASCLPDPDESNPGLNPNALPLCDNNVAGTVNLNLVAGTPPADNPSPLARAFVQKELANEWQAWSGYPADAGAVDPGDGTLHVDFIDWGDNLESVDWYTKSMVRTEVVLLQTLPAAKLEYQMRHVSGWGINEVHGLAATWNPVTPILGPGTQATVYSYCAGFSIQKLLVPKGSPELATLEWMPRTYDPVTGNYEGGKWVGAGLVSENTVFNKAVREQGDGPGYYSAEINVKGRVIYGYTWNVKLANEGPGDYRLTFSLDEECGNYARNTFFTAETEILQPLEEEAAPLSLLEADLGGGKAMVDVTNNLTYIDISILDRGGGGGGGKGPRPTPLK